MTAVPLDDAPALAALRAVFERVAAAQHIATTDVLATDPDLPRLAEHTVADAFRRLGELLVARADPAIACAQGCYFCCHQPVAVTGPEAIALADVLRETFAEPWLTALGAALTRRVALIAGFATRDAYHAARLPCVFLAGDGACAVYEWRPLVCRAHRATSRHACQEEYADPAAGNRAVDAYGHVVGNAVLDGMRAACTAAGRDGALYEMHSALARALATPDAAARWAAGEDVFAGCDRRFVGPGGS